MKKRILAIILALCLCAALLSVTASAAENPYPKWQDPYGWGTTVRCTYYAWQQVYDNLGIALPGWGNGGTWLSSAANAGYATGTTPKADSLVVWTDGGYGHVEYVAAVNGTNITVNGGGYYNTDHTPHQESGQDVGVWRGLTKPGSAGSNFYGQILAGYIYFDGSSGGGAGSVTATFTEDTTRKKISGTDVTLAARLTVSGGASISNVSKVGIYLYDGSNKLLGSASDQVSYNDSHIDMWYNIKDEVYSGLGRGTYYYKFFAVISGKTYYSGMYSFSNGSSGSFTVHIHNKVRIPAQSPTCTESGNIEYWYCTKCENYYSSEASEEALTLAQVTLAPRGHSLTHYLPKAATETEDGYIEHWHCDVCGKYYADSAATKEITGKDTVIAKLGHTHGLTHIAAKAATEQAAGNIEYWYCSDCGKYFSDAAAQNEITQSQTVIAKLDHKHGLTHVAARAATETASGNIEYWYCAACGKYFSDAAAQNEITQSQTIIAKLNHKHNLTHIPAKAATCAEAGNTEYWHCSSCGKYFSDAAARSETMLTAVTLAALGHNYVDGVCTRCGATTKSTIMKFPIAVTVGGSAVQWTDAEPFIDANDRTMVPLRVVAETLGLTVDWNAGTRTASFTSGSRTIYFPIGSTVAYTTEGTVTMDTSAVISNDRTYAPIRYLAEYFGHTVGWDGNTRTVIIT